MKRAIVTGANGFLGSNLVKKLADEGVFVYALSRNSNNIPEHPLVSFVQLDVANIRELKETGLQADVFYHLAWEGSVGMDRADTALQLRNVQLTVDCLRTAKEIGCARFVGAGSIIEHENRASVMAQGSRPGLTCVYGAAKQAAHSMCKPVAASIGIGFIWVHITNVYGAGEMSGRLICSTLQKIICDKPLQFTDARQNYDFVYIDDAANAFYLIGRHGKPYSHYLLGSGSPRPLREFLLEIKSAVAPEKEFVFGDIPFNGVSLSLSEYDIGNLRSDTGFECSVSFAKGIKKTYEWLRTQEEAPFSDKPALIYASKSPEVLPTDFEGAKLIKPFFAYDNRGCFIKDYSLEFLRGNGLCLELKEVFYSHSVRGVVRGMHFQRNRQQTKFVRCVQGRIYDVIVDLRKGSSKFGKWQGFELSEHNKDALYVPSGFAHGFMTLEPSIVSYKCDESFFAEYDDGILWNDGDLGIDWPLGEPGGEVIISDKDVRLQTLSEFVARYEGLH